MVDRRKVKMPKIGVDVSAFSFGQRVLWKLNQRLGLDQYLEGSIPGRTASEATTPILFGRSIPNSEREFAATRSPVGHFITFEVGTDIFDKWFKIVNIDDENDIEMDKVVQSELAKLKARDVLTRMAILERLYGWSMIVIAFADSKNLEEEMVTNNAEITALQTYSENRITSINEERDTKDDRYGLPKEYLIDLGVSQRTKVNHTRAIHVATRLLFHRYKGESVIDPAYDDILSLRYIAWSVAMTMIRVGSGFPDIELEGATQKKIDAFIASQQFNNLQVMKYFVHNEKQQLEFKGMMGKALNPMPYYLIPLERISLATNIPLAILRGVQAGALTGSEVNEREYQGYLSDCQSRYEASIRELINKILHYTKEGKYVDTEYRLEWMSGIELSETDRSIINLRNEQTNREKLNYMSINELRLSIMGENSEVEGGDIIPGLEKIMRSGMGGGGFGETSASLPETVGVEVDEEKMEKDLKAALMEILQKVQNGDYDVAQGLVDAEMVITDVIQKLRVVAKNRIEQKVGYPISELPIEQERAFISMKKRYLADFRKLLEDATL